MLTINLHENVKLCSVKIWALKEVNVFMWNFLFSNDVGKFTDFAIYYYCYFFTDSTKVKILG